MNSISFVLKLFFLLVISTDYLVSEINEQKDFVQESQVFDLQKNKRGNFEFYTSNYGISFLNIKNSSSGFFWPRGSSNQYIFGAGLWFGCIKFNENSQKDNKMVVITYNPNSGTSWFVPGQISDGDSVEPSLSNKYRTYLSTNFNQITGEANNSSDGPNWSLWKSNSLGKFNYGINKYNYEPEVDKRNIEYYPEGPLFISKEDIFSIYKDTDLSRYEGGIAKRKSEGYPLRIEIQSEILSWDNEKMRDFIVMTYTITNKSNNILKNCYIADIIDPDIALSTNASNGAGNDRAKYYSENPLLNLGIVWTDNDRGEQNRDFGYLGIFLLETPAIDGQGNIRKDKLIYKKDEQLGLKSFRVWDIQSDLRENEERYNFLATSRKDAGAGPSDIRLVFSTGEFNLNPDERATIKIGIAAALPSKGGDADGTNEDMIDLINNVKDYTNQYYINQFTSLHDEIITKQNQIKITPIPASSILNIEIEKFSNENIDIYSINGEKILSQNFSHQIDISNLSTGVYILKIGEQETMFLKE